MKIIGIIKSAVVTLAVLSLVGFVGVQTLKTGQPAPLTLGDTQETLPAFKSSGNAILPRVATKDFAIGTATATTSGTFQVDPGLNRTTVTNLTITGTCTGCGAAASVASNSLDFDEFVTAMTVDVNTTITAGAKSLTFDHASTSGNFEIRGIASASFFTGSAFAGTSGNCTAAGLTLRWATTGLFSCATLADSDIPDTITLSRYADTDIPFITLGNTSSLSFERALTGTSRQIVGTDGGANSTLTVSIDPNLLITNASLSGGFEVGSFASISGNFTVNGTGSSSFAGSVNTTLGLHAATDVSAGLRFLGIGTGSNSFAGSLELAKGLRLTGATGLITASGAGSSSFAGSLNISKSLTATNNITGALFIGTGAGSSSFAGSLNLTKSLTSSKTVTATSFQGSGATSSSFAGSLNTTLGLHATTDVSAGGRFLGIGTGSNSFAGSVDVTGISGLSFFGEIKPDGATCTAGQILKKTAQNDWDCGTDNTSVAGGTGNVADGLDINVSGGTFFAIASLTFDANMFDFTNVASAGTIKLDWTNGPASRSAAQTITGAWEFRNEASASWLNVGGSPRLLNSIAQFASTSNNFAQVNFQNFSAGASASIDTVWTTNTGNNNRGFLDIGINGAAYQDAPFGIASKSEGYIYMQDRSLSIGTASTSAKAFLKFFVGGTTTANQIMTLKTSGASLSGDFDASGTASSSFAGSLDISKGISAAKWTGTFTASGVASHSFLGSLSGPSTGTLSVGTSNNPLKILWSNIGRFVNNLFAPTITTNAALSSGEFKFNTASASLVFGSTANTYGLSPLRCVSQTLAFSDLTNKNQWTIFAADEPYRLKFVQVTASGSNSLSWNLLTGSATVPTTNVFTSDKQASGSSVVRYTNFTSTASISDGQKLDLRVSSTSATLDSVFIRTCMELDVTP